ncbi:MAG: DNA-processing protein DprA [Romboutsia sp.]
MELIENNFSNIEDLMYISDKEVYDLKNINTNIKENIVKYRSLSYLDKIKENLHIKSIKYICSDDKNYPINLKHIYDAPKILFYKGDISIVNNTSLAMVGSRKPTDYGIHCAMKISEKLSNSGVNIISGLAIGIDSHCHLGAIKGSSKTIAVFASSVDNPLPKINTKLADKILEDGGLLLSEYNLGESVYRSNFANRNRIMSGISNGVIVVEAAEKSGSLITVEFALEQGKNVFAVPGNINSYMSKGCHKIIKEGAKLIENVDDILNEYEVISINCKEDCRNYDNIGLSEQSINIINAIKYKGVLHIDEICDNTRMEIKYVNTILSDLVLKDILIEMNNKKYSLNV